MGPSSWITTFFLTAVLLGKGAKRATPSRENNQNPQPLQTHPQTKPEKGKTQATNSKQQQPQAKQKETARKRITT